MKTIFFFNPRDNEIEYAVESDSKASYADYAVIGSTVCPIIGHMYDVKIEMPEDKQRTPDYYGIKIGDEE